MSLSQNSKILASDVAPKAHAGTATTYGIGTGSNYGHVKLSDSTSSTSAASAGIAASPKAVKAAYDKAVEAANSVGSLSNGIGNAKAYITETWKSGTSWYRKWSDGWIEQGGRATFSDTSKDGTITLHTAYTSQYTVLLTANGDGTRAVGSYNLNTTNFTVQRWNRSSSGEPPNIVEWYACGF